MNELPEAPVTNAYIAGIVDGEGSISMYKAVSRTGGVDGKRYRVRCSIANTNLEMLEFTKNYFGAGSIYTSKPKAKHKVVYMLYFYDNQAHQVIKAIRPYLIIKKKQADVAISFHDHVAKEKIKRDTRGRISNISPESIAFRIKTSDQLSKLNRRGVYGI